MSSLKSNAVALFTWLIMLSACVDSGAETLGAYEDVSDRRSFGLRPVGEFQEPPDNPFWAIGNLAVSANSVFVIESRAGSLHRYDRNGDYVSRVAGPGQGPGELSAPMALGVVGDTLWVLNTQNLRMEYFTTEGEYVASQRLPSGVFLSDAVLVNDFFVGNQVDGELPLVRFRRESTGGDSEVEPVFFGKELAAQRNQYEADNQLTNSPPVYRLASVGEDLWVTSYFHPIAAIYDRSQNVRRLLSYPDLSADRDASEREPDDGQANERPAYAGSSFAFEHKGVVHLLSLQTDNQNRQWLYMIESETGEPIGRITSPLDVLLGPMVSGGQGTVYATAIRPGTEEYTVLILEEHD